MTAAYALLEVRCDWCHVFPCACVLPRTERCACGGTLTARPETEAVRAAVEAHNATQQHRAWRARR